MRFSLLQIKVSGILMGEEGFIKNSLQRSFITYLVTFANIQELQELSSSYLFVKIIIR